MTDLELFIEAFNKVRNLGFHRTHRVGNTGIGKTFEDLLGVAENNLKEPDLHGFEVKSQRALSSSYVTLFTKSPTMPKSANTMLRENYGSYDSKYPDLKVLHASIFSTRDSQHKSGYKFTLNLDDDNQRLYLIVKKDELIENSETYWSYEVLKKTMEKKLTNLAFAKVETRQINGEEEFYFDKATIFSGFLGLDNFLDLLSRGDIMFDIRVGVYKTGPNRGKTHDHGSGFRIKRDNLKLLYQDFEVI